MNNKLLFIWVVAPTGTSLDTIRDRQCGGIASVLWLVSWIAVISAFLHESLCSCSFWREQLACSETNLFVSCCSCLKWPKGCSGVWIIMTCNILFKVVWRSKFLKSLIGHLLVMTLCWLFWSCGILSENNFLVKFNKFMIHYLKYKGD